MTTTDKAADQERRSVPAPDRGPGVSPERRRKLATCCAFFKAARYREAEPDKLRESDVLEAEQAITEVIETCGNAPRGNGVSTARRQAGST